MMEPFSMRRIPLLFVTGPPEGVGHLCRHLNEAEAGLAKDSEEAVRLGESKYTFMLSFKNMLDRNALEFYTGQTWVM